MRLTEIRIEGFGKLVNRTLAFAPGFNLIYGPNEAGKSTLQRAILALLYGFFDEGPITAAKRDLLAAFVPWSGAHYAGELVYALDRGQGYRVKRTFDSFLTTLYAYPKGSNVTRQFPKNSMGRLGFAKAQLGMSKEVFENVCYIRQAELAALELSPAALTDTLLRFSASASADIAASAALERLEEALHEQVGGSRAVNKPLPLALGRLEALRAERTQALKARQELYTHLTALGYVEKELLRQAGEHQRWQVLQQWATYQALARRLEAVRQTEAVVAAQEQAVAALASWADFAVQRRDAVIANAAQWRELQGGAASWREQTAQARAQLAMVAAQQAAAQERLAALTAGRVVVEPTDEVRELAAQGRAALEAQHALVENLQKARYAVWKAEQWLAQEGEQLGPVVALGSTGLALHQQRLAGARERLARATASLTQAQAEWAKVGLSAVQFDNLEHVVAEMQAGQRPASPPRRGCNPFAPRPTGFTGDPTELLIYAQTKPLQERLQRASAEAEVALKALSQEEAEASKQLAHLLPKTDEEHFQVLNQRLERYLRAVADVEYHRNVVQGLEADIEAVDQETEIIINPLCGALEQLGYEVSDVPAALALFARDEEQRDTLRQTQSELEHVQATIQALRRAVQGSEEREQALAAATTRLRDLLAEAHIPVAGEEIEAALQRFQEGVEQHAHWSSAQHAREEAQARLQMLLGDQARTELEEQVAGAEQQLATLRAAHPEGLETEAKRSPSDYEALLRRSEEELASLQQKRETLRDALRNLGRGPRALAEIDEEIALLQEEITRLERYGKALELAHRELSEATRTYQELLVPRLQEAVSEGLARVTGGRYTTARVDPRTLEVRVQAPESGEYVPAERLSTGTRDLIYLLLRVAIARLMSTTQEKLPLLVDDSFAQSDRAREEQGLGFLAQVATETQILFFTKDERVQSWFAAHLQDNDAHRLIVLG